MITASSLHSFLPAVANHLWQSTLFCAVAALLTLLLRNNPARIRHAVWLTASIKFLVPFALLMNLGTHFARPRVVAAAPTIFYNVINQASQPFSRTTLSPHHSAVTLAEIAASLWLAGVLIVLAQWSIRWRKVRAAARRATPLRDGREYDALRNSEQRLQQRPPISLLRTQANLEPGIFGILRPRLLWPAGLSSQLNDTQLEAVFAHELFHARRHDNLVAALHMFVEAVFWFHPLVWWLGARLIDERERACDEAVLLLGSPAETYAQSILKACEFCLESPLACVSGVSGSNLEKRIVHIMTQPLARKLSRASRFVLAAVAVAALTTPVIAGVFHSPQVRADALSADASTRAFDQVSLKPSQSGGQQQQIKIDPYTFTGTNVTVRKLIAFAYNVNEYQIENAPSWVDTERYDIQGQWKDSGTAPAEAPALAPLPALSGSHPGPGQLQVIPDNHVAPGQLQAMLKTLLADRFQLQLNHSSTTLPIYTLEVADSGPKLTAPPNPPATFKGEFVISVRKMEDKGESNIALVGPVGALAGMLSEQMGRQVVDRTGLTGVYDMNLSWKSGADLDESIMATLPDQLGLKLEPAQGPVDTLTINQVEKPTEE